MTARERMSHRKPPPLSPEDADRVARLLAVAVDAAGQLRQLLFRSPADDPLAEVERLLELAGVHAAAEAEITRESERRNSMGKPLTVDRFVDAFRLDMDWECAPGTRITNELTEFATEREGSTRDIIELLVIFKIFHGFGASVQNAAAIEALP